MKMNDEEKHIFIREHLSHELRCLLGAVTVWQRFKERHQGFDVVVAMDSAFVHARCLFNFFCGNGKHDVSVTEFGPSEQYKSDIFETWNEELNRHVLHIKKGRLSPNNVKDGVHLNEQAENFAQEILKLWKRLEKDNSASIFTKELYKAREEAIKNAKNDTKGEINPIFTLEE